MPLNFNGTFIMQLTEFLTPDHIYYDVVVSSKKRLLELVGKTVAESIQLEYRLNTKEMCPVICFENLFKREKLGCTSIGNGIALPHAKLPSDCAELNRPIALFFKLEQPIDYEASDNKEVDLVYAMMFPEGCCEKYKGCLQQIAQKLSDKTLAKQLRATQSADEIWQILAYIDRQSETEE